MWWCFSDSEFSLRPPAPIHSNTAHDAPNDAHTTMSASMSLNAAGGSMGLLKDGYQSFSGVQEAVLKNTEAIRAFSEILRTSMGPNGMNKMVINHLDKLFVTSDAATVRPSGLCVLLLCVDPTRLHVWPLVAMDGSSCNC